MSDIIRACYNGDLSKVKTLVTSGCDINTTNSYGSTGLMLSLRYKNWSTSEYLLALDTIDTNIKNDYGYNALHSACIHGASTDIVSKIVSKSDIQTINCRNSDGDYTPIMKAIEYGHTALVSLLSKVEMIDWDKEELVMVAR